MKLSIALALLLSSLGLSATKIEIPLEGHYYVNHREVKVNIKKLNKELSRLGLDGLPEVLVIGSNPKAFHKIIEKRVEAANEALNRDMNFNVVHDGYIFRMQLCYRGNITDVPDLIAAMRGNFLHPDQGILAIGAGQRKVVNDEAFHSREGLKVRFDSEYEPNLPTINQWLGYKATSKKALVMSDYGPQGDGTELEATEIPPCQE